MRAPTAAARTNAPASTDQSRPVLGPSLSGWAGSLGASIAVGAVWVHHLRSQDMTRAYGSGRPCNIDEKSTLQPTKGETSEGAGRPFGHRIVAVRPMRGRTGRFRVAT